MRWWYVSIHVVLFLTLATACNKAGMQQITKDEVERINMKTFQEGSARQQVRGATLNTALLRSLKAECSKRSIRLTHETYAEGLDGDISYSYFINGDARHFLIVNVYPNEADRIRKITEIYGSGDGTRVNVFSNAGEANVISTKNNVALIYASSGVKKSKYSSDIEDVFEQVLGDVTEHLSH